MTYVENGNEVVGFEDADDAAEEEEAAEDAPLEERQLNIMKSTLRTTEV